jgi:hypothetical protein
LIYQFHNSRFLADLSSKTHHKKLFSQAFVYGTSHEEESYNVPIKGALNESFNFRFNSIPFSRRFGR